MKNTHLTLKKKVRVIFRGPFGGRYITGDIPHDSSFMKLPVWTCSGSMGEANVSHFGSPAGLYTYQGQEQQLPGFLINGLVSRAWQDPSPFNLLVSSPEDLLAVLSGHVDRDSGCHLPPLTGENTCRRLPPGLGQARPRHARTHGEMIIATK